MSKSPEAGSDSPQTENRPTLTKQQWADAIGVTVRQLNNWQNQDNDPHPASISGRPAKIDVGDGIEWLIRREVKKRVVAAPDDAEFDSINIERERARKLQTDRILNELAIEKERRESIPVQVATAIVAQYAKEYRSSTDALPGQMKDEFPELTQVHLDFLRDRGAETGNKLASIRIDWDALDFG